MSRGPSPWSHPHGDETLRAAREAGVGSIEIARRVTHATGVLTSRNAVIGRAFRLGLPSCGGRAAMVNARARALDETYLRALDGLAAGRLLVPVARAYRIRPRVLARLAAEAGIQTRSQEGRQ